MFILLNSLILSQKHLFFIILNYFFLKRKKELPQSAVLRFKNQDFDLNEMCSQI